MTSVPQRIIERRAELDNLVEHHRRAVEDHRHWLAVKEAERDGIDLCIAAIEDAAKTPSGEAGDGAEASVATPQAPEAENAPAGSVEALSGIEPKKPRAPKRDIRGMVLRYVESNSQPENAIEIAAALGVLPPAVDKAVAYWQAKGRLTLDGGVVRLRADGVAVEADGAHRVVLIDFLARNPDSMIGEITAIGVPAAEVHRAEHDGVVFAKAHGLYALVEPHQSAAAE